MKSQVSIKTKIGAIAVAVGMMLGGAVAVASSASAVPASVTTTCEELTVVLTGYQINDPNDPADPTPNHITVIINGIGRIDTDFGTAYSQSFSFPPLYQSSSYTVVVYAWDNPDSADWSINRSGTVQGCPAEPPVTHEVTLPTVIPPTCYAEGSVTVPRSEFYEWVRMMDGFYHAVGDNLTGTLIFDPGSLAQLECTHEVTLPTVIPPTCYAEGSVTVPVSEFYEWVRMMDGFYHAVGERLTGTLIFDPGSLAQLECGVRDINVTPPVYIAPTCDAAGSLVVPPATALYVWSIQNGIYTAYRTNGNYTITGAGPFGPFPLAQLTGAQCIGEVNPPVVNPPVAVVVPPKTVKAPKVKAPKVTTPKVRAAKVATVTPATEKALAFTGAESIPLGVASLVMLLLGGALTTVKRYLN